MSILRAIIIGLIHGFTEILPVSGSGHLSVLYNILLSDYQEEMIFDALLHFATLVSIIVVFWQDIAGMVIGVLGIFNFGDPRESKSRYYPAARLFLMFIVAVVPLFFIIPIKKYVDQLYYNTVFVGVCFVLTGLLLFISDRFIEGKKTGKNMSVLDAIIIGICQCVAIIPGISRTGVTITSGMATGLKKEFAYKFSFLVSIPALLGVNILNLIAAIKEGIEWSHLPAYLIGMVVAMVSCLGALTVLKRIVKNGKFSGIAYYCWLVGAMTIILTFIF